MALGFPLSRLPQAFVRLTSGFHKKFLTFRGVPGRVAPGDCLSNPRGHPAFPPPVQSKGSAHQCREGALMSDDRFTEEQRQYLQGFVAGADLARSASGLPTFGRTLARNGVLPSPAATPGPSSPLGPESLQYEAQSRLLAEGKKLCPRGGGEAAEVSARPLG